MRLNEYLSKFEKISRIPSLEGIEQLMKEYEIHKKKTKFIHIAGTNGKGSLCEMLNNILINAGFKVRKIHFSTSDKI